MIFLVLMAGNVVMVAGSDLVASPITYNTIDIIVGSSTIRSGSIVSSAGGVNCLWLLARSPKRDEEKPCLGDRTRLECAGFYMEAVSIWPCS